MGKTLVLTIEAEIETDGTSESWLRDNFYYIADHAAAHGLMTGESEAEVLSWSALVKVLPSQD